LRETQKNYLIASQKVSGKTRESTKT